MGDSCDGEQGQDSRQDERRLSHMCEVDDVERGVCRDQAALRVARADPERLQVASEPRHLGARTVSCRVVHQHDVEARGIRGRVRECGPVAESGRREAAAPEVREDRAADNAHAPGRVGALQHHVDRLADAPVGLAQRLGTEEDLVGRARCPSFEQGRPHLRPLAGREADERHLVAADAEVAVVAERPRVGDPVPRDELA